MEHVLAVDLGTGGPKVALVGLDGTIADRELADPTAARPRRRGRAGPGRLVATPSPARARG